MINANARPLTGNMTDSLISYALRVSPVTVVEYLLHGWESLAIASREPAKRDAAVASARRMLEGAEKVAARTFGKRPRLYNAAKAEIENLRREIASA